MAAPEDNSRARTEYVVLRHVGEHWELLAQLHAHSANAAARAAARDQLDAAALDQGVELRAVSARAWEVGHARLKAKHETRIVPT
jgi:hypothetical protein